MPSSNALFADSISDTVSTVPLLTALRDFNISLPSALYVRARFSNALACAWIFAPDSANANALVIARPIPTIAAVTPRAASLVLLNVFSRPSAPFFERLIPLSNCFESVLSSSMASPNFSLIIHPRIIKLYRL